MGSREGREVLKSGKPASEFGSVTTEDTCQFSFPRLPSLYLVTGPSCSRGLPLPDSLMFGHRIGFGSSLANHGIFLLLASGDVWHVTQTRASRALSRIHMFELGERISLS